MKTAASNVLMIEKKDALLPKQDYRNQDRKMGNISPKILPGLQKVVARSILIVLLSKQQPFTQFLLLPH